MTSPRAESGEVPFLLLGRNGRSDRFALQLSRAGPVGLAPGAVKNGKWITSKTDNLFIKVAQEVMS